jgi:hypothetical protein
MFNINFISKVASSLENLKMGWGGGAAAGSIGE